MLFFFATWDTDGKFRAALCQAEKRNCVSCEKLGDSNLHKGIYIDIFPFDKVPEKF
jgi:hypothetical protein